MSNINYVEIINNTIQDTDVYLISYISTEGYPITKALTSPRKIEPHGTYYFSTVNHSMKTESYRKNPKASLYFLDREKYIGVSLVGRMEIIDDIESKKVFWLPTDNMFYPNGIESDDYVILKFTSESGRLYAQIQHINFDPQEIL